MARKKKNQLPSGSIRVQRVIGKDENGKRIVKSFTAPTKSEANRIADQYVEAHKNNPSVFTLSQAIAEYIRLREHTLSPTTIRGYRSDYKSLAERFPSIMDKYLTEVNSDDIQAIIDGILDDKKTGKTARNRTLLVTKSLKHFNILITGYQLPARQRPDIYVPSDAEMQTLFQKADGKLIVPIYLAAFGPMRAGECLGLQEDSIKDNTIHVWRTMYTTASGCKIKPLPKTLSSNRYIVYPDFVIKAIRQYGLPKDMTLNMLDYYFQKLLKECDLPHFRFHDLRHWCASTLHAQGMPDAYIMQRGGWSSDHTLQTVYRHTLADQSEILTAKALNHFANFV